MAAGCAARRSARPVRGSFADYRSQAPRSSVIATLRNRLTIVPPVMAKQHVEVFGKTTVLDVGQVVFDGQMALYQIQGF